LTRLRSARARERDAALLGVLAFVVLLSLAMVTLLRRRRTELVPA